MSEDALHPFSIKKGLLKGGPSKNNKRKITTNNGR